MSAVFGLTSEKCLAQFLAFEFTSQCVKDLLVNGINLGILFGAVAIKLPQIIKIVRAKSVDGISESSLALELLSSTCACLYASLIGHPFSTWGEMLFIAIQCFILNVMFWYLSPRISKTRRILAVLAAATAVAYTLRTGLAPQYLPVLASTPITLNLLARVPQIALNYRQKHTGQLAFLSFALAFLGNLARIFTTVMKLSDPLTLASHAIAATLNGLLVGQILMYPKRDVVKKKQ